MCNMLKSEPDLFACGTRVLMPSVRATAGKRYVRTDASTENQQTKRSSGISCSVKRQVSELSKTLVFSEEVVSDISPDCVSYANARGGMRSLFKPDGLGLDMQKKTAECVGRHDCRGEPKRHLPCHLHQSRQEQAISMCAREKTFHTQPSYHEFQGEHLRYADGSGLDLQHAKVVPPSRSLPWEEQTLQRLSTSTKTMLEANRVAATERERTKSSIEKSPQKSHHLGHKWSSGETTFPEGPRIQNQRPTDSDVLPQPKDFLTELRRGAHPVHQLKGDGTTIVLDNAAHFDKVLQSSFPQQPREWYEMDTTSTTLPMGRTYMRGQQRWMDMPQPARTPEDLQWECQSLESLQHTDHSPSPPGSPANAAEIVTTATENREFFHIMHEWCDKWHIHVQPNNVTTQSILEDLDSLCSNSRMFAIAATALLAENHTRNIATDRLQRHTTSSEVATAWQVVFPHLAAKLCQLLDDPVVHVRVPAAVTLYCMGRENDKAEQVLLSALDSGHSSSEQWTSVQCLALAGVSSPAVITSLLQHLLKQKADEREQAAALLARVSRRTSLVHAMLAELLNCTGWQERLSACHLLPRLHGGINKDLCSKLVVLTWEDWSPEVRQAAAQALGLSGHGKLIHDEIQRRLTSGSETVRLDALKKLHSLGLMTSHLLPPFLSCFKDDHVSIRMEATAVAGSLKLRDKQVLQAIQGLLQDPCWKVKAQALRALGEIGVCDGELVGQLLWAVRFEKLAEVRAEACHTIASLGLKEEQVVKTLRDLRTVEEDLLVLREVSLTLQQLGCDAESEDDLLGQIRSEVKKLGTQQAITRELLHLERRDTTDYVIKRPQVLPSTRDYLSDKHRYEVFTSTSQPSGGAKTKQLCPVASRVLRPGGELGTGKPWSPDRKTIDAQLEAIRRHCTLGAESVTETMGRVGHDVT